MDIVSVLGQVRSLLQQEGRLSYRILKRQFALNDEALDDLKYELIEVQEVAIDNNGKMLVWVSNIEADKRQRRTDKGENGETGSTEDEKGKGGKGEKEGTPGRWTPAHLADPSIRFLAGATQEERVWEPRVYTPKHLIEKILTSRAALEGERKTITALFADLKGSTALIEGLDPEEARAIIDPALQLMMDAVHRYEGYVAQALGDGIFALFGAPIAHEDHPTAVNTFG